MNRQSPAKTAMDWLLRNLLIQLSLQKLSDIYIRVRYEDFVTRPSDEVRKISAAAGMTLPNIDDVLNTQAIRANDHHMVAGNPRVRARLNDTIPLALDDEWQTKLPRAQKWLVTAMCASLMAVYGYSLNSSRPAIRGCRTNRSLREPSQPVSPWSYPPSDRVS